MNQPSYVYPSKTVNQGFSLPTLINFSCSFHPLSPSFPPSFPISISPLFFYPNSHQLPLERFPPHLVPSPVEHYKLFTHACSVMLDGSEFRVCSSCSKLHAVFPHAVFASCSVCFMCSTHYKMHTAAGLFSCQ